MESRDSQTYYRGTKNFLRHFGNSGFTLIEIIISLVIFVIGVLAVFYLFPIGLKASGLAGQLSKVTFLAQEKIEMVKAGLEVLPQGEQGDISWELFIREITPPGVEDVVVQEINLTLAWQQGDRQRQETFITYVFK
jgi:prepilin-type N-terminal cleavage/methylation domain-containing protein